MIPGQSYMGLLNDIIFSEQPTGSKTRYLLNKVIEYFPSFRDESVYEGRKVVFWKRAQILIAETWWVIQDLCRVCAYSLKGPPSALTILVNHILIFRME